MFLAWGSLSLTLNESYKILKLYSRVSQYIKEDLDEYYGEDRKPCSSHAVNKSVILSYWNKRYQKF